MTDTVTKKVGHKWDPVLLTLLILIISLLAMPRIMNYINDIPVMQFRKQLRAYPLPEKPEAFSIDNSGSVASLIISSDLSFAEIKDYYRSIKFKPVLFGKQKEINIYVDEWDLDSILYFIAETGSERLVTETKYQHYYTILLSYDALGDGSGSVRAH